MSLYYEMKSRNIAILFTFISSLLFLLLRKFHTSVALPLKSKGERLFSAKRACFGRGRFRVGPVGNARSLMSATPGV